jgi:predicted HNH restriction endonuclease
MDQEDHIDEFGRSLEVHHLTPVREFDDPLDAHDLSNLVTLCRPCHKELENMPLDTRHLGE